MADSSKSDRSTPRPSVKTSKLVRSQKIIQLSPSDTRPQDIPEDSEPARERGHAPPRSHTPGHLSTKSQDRRKKQSDLSLRSRSQSLSQKDSSPSLSSKASSSSKPPSISSNGQLPKIETPISPPIVAPAVPTQNPPRPLNLRSTSAIAPKASATTSSSSSSPAVERKPTITPQQKTPRGPHTSFPPLPDPTKAPDVQAAPASGMYWSKAPVSGDAHTALRAHTTTLVGSNIYVFGGCDARTCFNELYVFDADAFHFSSPYVCGDIPVPLRAMTCTAVGKKLIVFGGGDGPAYYNDVAHTACLYKNGIYVFGGGDGVRALNDVWRLDVADTNKMSWKLISPPSPASNDDRSKPKARGYHTANMVGSKLIIYGGSDGGECFRDVWIFDVETLTFAAANIPTSFPRLSHTATIVGSYLFVIGGHDGVEYCNEVLLLNLVNMAWDKRKIYGIPPKARGYHGTVLHDSRLVVIGGFDGQEVFGDVQILELAVHAYYSQISHFSIDV